MSRHHATPDAKIPFTDEEETARDAEEAQFLKDQEAYAKIKYKNDRKAEFNSKHPMGDQLDYIFHHGVVKWKVDIVQPVKDKYPKPS